MQVSCVQDPDTGIAAYQNLHPKDRRACFYVAAEWDDIGCRNAPGTCVRRFQLGWVKLDRPCEMDVSKGFNAVHSVVDSPSPYKQVAYAVECETICLADPACDLAVWHEASVNAVWGNVCVTLSRDHVLDVGRWEPSSWVEQVDVVTMVKRCPVGESGTVRAS
jgi:hypothetical protein